jgi:hypothetical protein
MKNTNKSLTLDQLTQNYIEQLPQGGDAQTTGQRSEEWFKKRMGKFTGSRMKDLMSCKSRKKGKNWGEKFWLCDFGDTALNYIVERAIERATGNRIETPTTWQMQWGTNLEPIAKEEISKRYNVEIQDVDFELFIKNAGASADGKVLMRYNYGINPTPVSQSWGVGDPTPIEIKCPATVKSHYELINAPVDESHDYFWQLQCEMLAQKANQMVFFSYDPRYPQKAQLAKHDVFLSESHSFAIKFRCLIAEMLVGYIIESNFKLDVRSHLEAICNNIPEKWDELNDWYVEHEKLIKL